MNWAELDSLPTTTEWCVRTGMCLIIPSVNQPNVLKHLGTKDCASGSISVCLCTPHNLRVIVLKLANSFGDGPPAQRSLPVCLFFDMDRHEQPQESNCVITYPHFCLHQSHELLRRNSIAWSSTHNTSIHVFFCSKFRFKQIFGRSTEEN